MKRLLVLVPLCLIVANLKAQLLSWAPQFPSDNSTINITMNPALGNKDLLGFTGDVYMHLGVITNLSNSTTDWRYVPTTWATTTAPKATFNSSTNTWNFELINPRAFFNAAAGGVPAGETILKMALLFRDATGTKVQKNADGTDMYIPIYPAGSNHIIFTQPSLVPTFTLPNEGINAAIGQTIPFTAVASTNAGSLKLSVNGTVLAGPLVGVNTISSSQLVTSTGNKRVVSELLLNGNSYYDTVEFYVPVIQALPANVKEGINYGTGCDSVTLVLYAPGKVNAAVIGDFPGSNWVAQEQYQMNRTPDGDYYWLTVRGLAAGTEYSFQYLVDNSIYIADPYSEKILDPWNDPFIPAATYPSLKPYPVNANVSSGKNGLISILQTCAPAYKWQVNNFERPEKKNLITYELLVRDFGDAKNYQMLIDTISYFKRLGINAIELMPVNEFSGNVSWGYNPVFYLALDKAYGTKNKFKEFIDLCHKNGIAVILDVVYNHLDAFNAPQGKMYWDATNGRPATNNPWLNISAPHPYSVFEDLNHSNTATQYLVKRALEYWIEEYKIDGYRFDLAKGFTQNVTNETTVENFDGLRVENLYRYYDHIIPMYPATYMILEFLGTQRFEEQLYASHGFLLWSKSTTEYNEATMGYAPNSNFSKVVYNSSQTAFTTPAAMGYMESHDEERMMIKNLQFGNNAGGYNVKELATALDRQAAAAAVFFTVPGPKLIWQFGERGYDVSIDFNGRTGNKPPRWEYMADVNRAKLYNAYAKLINLRVNNPAVFTNTSFSYDFADAGGLVKRFQIGDPSANGMKVTVVANLDVTAQTRSITFQNIGNWYNYLSNGTGTGINGNTASIFNISAAAQNITLQPGEYHVFIYQPPNVYTFIGSGNWTDAANWMYNTVPPAILTTGSEIIVSPQSGGECILNTAQTIGSGAKFSVTAGRNIRIPLNLNLQ